MKKGLRQFEAAAFAVSDFVGRIDLMKKGLRLTTIRIGIKNFFFFVGRIDLMKKGLRLYWKKSLNHIISLLEGLT